MTKTLLSELEIELELKYYVPLDCQETALKGSLSAHRIDQCYFHSALVQFHPLHAPCRVAVAGIELTFSATEKQRHTLLAILDQTPDPTIRLRRMDDAWYFTVKGLSMDEGTLEFEVEISHQQGLALVPHAFQSLQKTRHIVQEDEYLWEVDVYAGKLSGLVIAELENRNYAVFPPVSFPVWASLDVTNDFRYKNACLAALPDGGLEVLLAENTLHP